MAQREQIPPTLHMGATGRAHGVRLSWPTVPCHFSWTGLSGASARRDAVFAVIGVFGGIVCVARAFGIRQFASGTAAQRAGHSA